MHPFIAELRSVLGDPERKSIDFREFIERFKRQSMFIRIEPLADSGKVDVAFVQGEEMELPLLVVALDEAATARLFDRSRGETVQEVNGSFILAMASQARFDLLVEAGGHAVASTNDEDDEDDNFEALAYDQLLAFQQLDHIEASIGVVPSARPSAPVLAPPFARWLYDYARSHAEIRRVWLGFSSIADEAVSDIVVLLDADNHAEHRQAIRAASARWMVPGQMLLMPTEGGSYDAIKQSPPHFCRSHGQGWWSRLLRRVRPTPMILVQVELTS